MTLFTDIADMISAVTGIVTGTGLTPVAFMFAVVAGGAYLLSRSIRAAR